MICLIAMVVVSVPKTTAQAQIVCSVIPEIIINLRPSMFGFPTVWDASYGKIDDLTQFASGVAKESGTLMAAGRRLSAEDFTLKDIVLVELNRRGRALTEKSFAPKRDELPIKLIASGDGYIMLSDMKSAGRKPKGQIRLSWYDKEGNYRKQKIYDDAAFNYAGQTIIHASGGNGYIIVAHGVNLNNQSDENAVLIRVNSNGDIIWRRSYRPGIPNMLANLSAVDESSYIGAGRIRLEDGRMAGWAMKLAQDGAIMWQRTYPRGNFTSFMDAAPMSAPMGSGDGYLLSGMAQPSDNGIEAGYVAFVDNQGEPVWQRYIRRTDHQLSVPFIEKKPDGRIQLVVQANIMDGEIGQDHIRMLVMSPRGAVIQDEAYYEGRGARAMDFTIGSNQERIITAIIDEDPKGAEEEIEPIVVVGLVADVITTEEQEEATKIKPPPIERGWALVATALDPYNDPCANQPF